MCFTLDAPKQLIVDLLLSLQTGPRQYAEIMEAWRTSCPRLPVWEDALDAGFVDRNNDMVSLTGAGKEWLSDQSGKRALDSRC
jgi:hypothetical protein